MKCVINIRYEILRPFIEKLPEIFDGLDGTTIHDGRNTIRLFMAEGIRIAVKRFKRPDPLRGFFYGRLRASKAERAYCHALTLRRMGFDTPEPVAWCEYRRHGALTESYFVALYTAAIPISEHCAIFLEPQNREVLDAFAAYAITLHNAGIDHLDLNHGNILFMRRGNEIRFTLVDINRMKFHQRPLSPREAIVNLRRLACPTPAYFYIIERYAMLRGWPSEATHLSAAFHRFSFIHRRMLKKRILHRK